MSIESAKACFERMKTDEDFAKKAGELQDKEAQMAFVRAAGYDFTLEEVDGYMGEMTDDELEAVAGGIFKGYPSGLPSDGGPI